MSTYFAIQTLDKPGHTQMRVDVRAEHLVYLKAHMHRLVAAGALLQDDGASTAGGGILLIEATDRADAERFANEDPYAKAGLFQSITVTRWRKAFVDGKSFV